MPRPRLSLALLYPTNALRWWSYLSQRVLAVAGCRVDEGAW